MGSVDAGARGKQRGRKTTPDLQYRMRTKNSRDTGSAMFVELVECFCRRKMENSKAVEVKEELVDGHQENSSALVGRGVA